MDKLLIPKQRAMYRKLNYTKIEEALDLREKVESYYYFNILDPHRGRFFSDIKAAFSIFCYDIIGLSYSTIGIIMKRGHDVAIYYNKQRHRSTVKRRIDEITLLYSGITPRNNVDEVISIVENHFNIKLNLINRDPYYKQIREHTLLFVRNSTSVNSDELVMKLSVNGYKLSNYLYDLVEDQKIMNTLQQILSEYVTRRNNKPS